MTTQPYILTYYDAVAAAMDFLGGNAASASQQDIRACIQAAYQELGTMHGWSFSARHGRVNSVAEHTTGTLTYDDTGGANERLVTFTDAIPSWAADTDKLLALKVDGTNALHLVDTYLTNKTITLDSVLNPGADVDALTSFRLFALAYHLPHDFQMFNGPWAEQHWQWGSRVEYSELMAMHRYADSSGDMRYWCLRANPDLHNTMSLYIYPTADAVETIDFVYDRYPRQLRHTGHETAEQTGTISISGAEVTSSDTTFAASMVGSLMRVGNSSNVPTGLGGRYPFAEQQTISARASATALTLSDSLTTAAGVKYCITDIIDLEYVAHEAFHACVRKHLAVRRNMKNKADFAAEYQDALLRAKAADHRGPLSEGFRGTWHRPRRLIDQVTFTGWE